jgi:flagellar protein FlaI
VLSLFIRGEKKIVSIEDTSELKLPHSHWVPTVARTVIAGEEKVSEVDMFDLLKESLRQRPDYIIVGEVRGKEAYIMFQQIATGHPSLATIHAEDMDALVNRLTTPPISLPPGLIASLDLVVFLTTVKYREKYVRRINEILEVTDFDMENKRPTVNQVFKWNAAGDKFLVSGKSFLLKNISELSGVSEQEIKDELERRMVVLNWMKEKNITDYRDVYRILTIYYSSPQKLLSIIIGEE